MDNILKKLLKTHQTVFSFKELLIKSKSKEDNLKSQLNYYIKNGDLYHIRRGLYAKNKNYNKLELAVKILTPSYVGFETVLSQAGIIFQYYSSIFVASYQSREIKCDNHVYIFRKIKSEILTDFTGIQILNNSSIATPERAFLDILYLHKEFYFDNLEPINWKKVYEILPIYKNKRMSNIVKKYHQEFIESQ